MLSFLLFQFGWPLACHSKTPCSSNDIGTQTGACFLNVRIKALDALAPSMDKGPSQASYGLAHCVLLGLRGSGRGNGARTQPRTTSWGMH